MDGNKEEALRCVKLAREAVGKGDKKRALKFIGIARRLNHNLDIADVVAACEKIDSEPSASVIGDGSSKRGASEAASVKSDGNMNDERSYTEEHIQLIWQVKRTNDYYAVLGLKKGCSAEEIRKAYKKLSLKVHPDKNNAPGSDEAFKKVCKAFKCLSDDSSRRQYDQMGLVDEFEFNQQHNVRRRRPARNDYFDDDFDPDEIFRAFFGQRDMFRGNRVYRSSRTAAQPRENRQDTGPNLILLIQVVAFLIVVLLAYLPFSEPQFSLQKNHTYQFPQKTEKYGIEFFVKSAEFNQDFPLGSSSRDDVEDTVIKDYTLMLRRYCHVELQRRQWSRNLPTPNCEKLRNLGMT